MLRLEHVHKSYGRRPVLEDVDLTIPSGSFVLVVGPNGSGKTTLLRLLATTVRPTSGRMHWAEPNGRPLPSLEAARRRIGYAGHVPLVYDELTALENLEFALRVRSAHPERVHEAAPSWLERFGLFPRAHERAATFSRGQRQRLALCLAFAPGPDFLLLDEPGSSLDTAGAEILLEALRATKGTATVVLATHQPDPFRPLADRTLEVNDARVRDWGGAR